MKACSLIAFSLLISTATSKYCLDTKGRFMPNIFLEQSTVMANYAPFRSVMSATNDPKSLNGTFGVGSYNVPRTMGLDMDGALTIIQADNVTVTTQITLDPYYEDIQQALLALERVNQSYPVATPIVSSLLQKFYIPYLSTSITYWDLFKHLETRFGSYGHLVQDQICLSTAASNAWCYLQSFQTSHWFTQNINPCQGVIGLGFSTPTYGQNFVSNLAANSNGKLSALWSFTTGGFYQNNTVVQIGGIDTTIVNTLRSPTYFNVNDASRWMIALSSFFYNGVSMGKQGVSDSVHFNILGDSIALPTSIYTQVTAQLMQAAPGVFTCNQYVTKMCIANQVCGCIKATIPSMTFQFGNSKFILPSKDLLIENANQTCSFQVTAQADPTLDYIDIGSPFFSAFYTIYDVANKRVGIISYPYPSSSQGYGYQQ